MSRKKAYKYDNNGNLVYSMNPCGSCGYYNETYYKYDDQNREIHRKDKNGFEWWFKYSDIFTYQRCRHHEKYSRFKYRDEIEKMPITKEEFESI